MGISANWEKAGSSTGGTVWVGFSSIRAAGGVVKRCPCGSAETAKLNDYVTAVTLRVANADTRPSWNSDSFFKRFVK